MEDAWFMDELLGEPYHDPVMAEDGFIYERSFIEEWFRKGGTKSPKTLLPIGTALFYPFEYYQARSAWAAAKGLPEPKKPDQYGRIGGALPQPPVRVQRTWIYAHEPITIFYNDLADEDDPEFSQEDFPPLPPPSPPTRVVRRQ